MNTVRLTDKTIDPLIPHLVERGQGGAFVSGDAGTGKSVMLANLALRLIAQGYSCTVIDPGDGSLVRMIEGKCHCFTRRIWDRMRLLHPAAGLCCQLNPLAVSDPTERSAVVSLTGQ